MVSPHRWPLVLSRKGAPSTRRRRWWLAPVAFRPPARVPESAPWPNRTAVPVSQIAAGSAKVRTIGGQCSRVIGCPPAGLEPRRPIRDVTPNRRPVWAAVGGHRARDRGGQCGRRWGARSRTEAETRRHDCPQAPSRRLGRRAIRVALTLRGATRIAPCPAHVARLGDQQGCLQPSR